MEGFELERTSNELHGLCNAEKETGTSDSIEIAGTAKPSKHKPAPIIATSPSVIQKTQTELKAHIEKHGNKVFENFGDSNAQALGFASTVVKIPNSNQVVVHKCNNGNYESIFINEQTGESTPTLIDPSDKTKCIISILKYKEYFVCFLFDGEKTTKMRISKDGLVEYSSAIEFRTESIGQPIDGHKYNTNRNVQLEGDMLYFIDTNSNIVIFDLKKLLDIPKESRNKYTQQTLTGPFEHFCVENGHVATITIEGAITSKGKIIQSIGLGAHFSAIETLAGYFVVASYNTSTGSKVLSVYSTDLLKLAQCTLEGKYPIHNILLFIREGSLHVLAADNYDQVDHFVFNHDSIHIVQIFEDVVVGSGRIGGGSSCYGLVWSKPSEEAILMGVRTLKRIKL